MLSLNHMKNHIESNYGRLVSPVGSFPLVKIGGTPKVSPSAIDKGIKEDGGAVFFGKPQKSSGLPCPTPETSGLSAADGISHLAASKAA
jgi:hypothetical protein